MKFVCGLLLVVSLATSLPIQQQQSPAISSNPCTLEALYNVEYFHAFVSDETKYIKCDPWGQMSVKQCPVGSKWHVKASDCIFVNSTLWLSNEWSSDAKPENMSLSSSYCSFVGKYACQNEGVCSQHEDGFRCLCLIGTAGDYCEEKRQSDGTFGRLINASFSIELYKQNRPLLAQQMLAPMLNGTQMPPVGDWNMTLYDKVFLDNSTLVKVQKYLQQYENGTLRFDAFLNFFIEDFLAYIFPDLFFLNEFSNPIEQQLGFSTAIPKLLMVAKYSYDKFESIFNIFDEVLHKLSKYLIEKCPGIQNEAKSFYEIYDLLDDELDRLYNYTSSVEFELPMEVKNMTITKEMIKNKIWRDFARTLNTSYELFEMIVDLQDDLSIRKQLYNISMLEMEFAIANFTTSPELMERMGRLVMKNTEIWDVLSFYGFSHVLGDLIGVPIFETPMVQSTFQALVASEMMNEAIKSLEDGEESEARTQALMSMLEGEDDEDDDSLIEQPKTRSDTTQNLSKPQAQLAEPNKPKVVREELSTLKPLAQKADASTTIRPQAQLAETTTVRASALVSESTKPTREEKPVRPAALMSDSTTVRPQAQVAETTIRQVRGESTTVRSAAMVAESTTVRPSALVAEPSTTTRQLRGEATTVRSLAQLAADSTTQRPVREEKPAKPQAQVAETTTRQVRSESTTVRPQAHLAESTTVRSAAMVAESTTVRSQAQVAGSTTVRQQAQLAESTTVRSAAMVAESTTVRSQAQVAGSTTVRQQAQLAESTTVRSAAMVAESTTVRSQAQVAGSTTVRPAAMVAESTTVRPAAMVAESTTVRSQAQVAGSTTVRPAAMVAESTTVRPAAMVAESTTVRAQAQVAGSTTVRPAAMVAESTTVRPAAMVAESTTVRAQAQVAGSTTVRPAAMVAESTTVRPQAQLAETTTTRQARDEKPKLAALIAEQTTRSVRSESTTIRPQALVNESTTTSRA